MKLYYNRAKGRYSQLQRKESHGAPARVNCWRFSSGPRPLLSAARAGYADRNGARAGTRDPPAVPGQIAPELGRFAVDGSAAPGLGPEVAPSKLVLLRPSAIFAPFCDNGSDPLRPSSDRRSLSKRINCPFSAPNMAISALRDRLDLPSAQIAPVLRVVPHPKRSRAAMIGAVLPAGAGHFLSETSLFCPFCAFSAQLGAAAALLDMVVQSAHGPFCFLSDGKL